MRVSKWGNSLAIRLPTELVQVLNIVEGDEIAVQVADERTFNVARDRTLDEAFARLDALGWRLPEGFRFSREKANERGPLVDE
jgi:antitoxin MazE